jgi:hypothetical protein
MQIQISVFVFIASERVLLCAKWTILQLYNGMYKLYFGAMMIISACKIQTRLFGFGGTNGTILLSKI